MAPKLSQLSLVILALPLGSVLAVGFHIEVGKQYKVENPVADYYPAVNLWKSAIDEERLEGVKKENDELCHL